MSPLNLNQYFMKNYLRRKIAFIFLFGLVTNMTICSSKPTQNDRLKQSDNADEEYRFGDGIRNRTHELPAEKNVTDGKRHQNAMDEGELDVEAGDVDDSVEDLVEESDELENIESNPNCSESKTDLANCTSVSESRIISNGHSPNESRENGPHVEGPRSTTGKSPPKSLDQVPSFDLPYDDDDEEYEDPPEYEYSFVPESKTVKKGNQRVENTYPPPTPVSKLYTAETRSAENPTTSPKPTNITHEPEFDVKEEAASDSNVGPISTEIYVERNHDLKKNTTGPVSSASVPSAIPVCFVFALFVFSI